MFDSKPVIPISKAALTSRIRRHIAKDHWRLVHGRGRNLTQMTSNFGRVYVMDLRRNCVVEKYVEIEEYGRKLGVLKQWEFLEKLKSD